MDFSKFALSHYPAEKSVMFARGWWWFDSSIINDFLHCKRYFWYRHVAKKEESGGCQAPLQFGTIIHKAMDAYHASGNLDFLPELLTTFPDDWPDQDGKRSPMSLLKIMEAYQKFSNNDMELLLKPEQSFMLPVSSDVAYVGRIDFPKVRYRDMIVSVDHKTSSIWTTAHLQTVLSSGQIRGYWKAMKEFIPEVELFILNFIYVNKTMRKFARLPIKYTEEETQSWFLEVQDHIGNILERFKTGQWPREWNCAKWNRLCGFYGCCTSKSIGMFEDELLSRADHIWVPYELLKNEKGGTK